MAYLVAITGNRVMGMCTHEWQSSDKSDIAESVASFLNGSKYKFEQGVSPHNILKSVKYKVGNMSLLGHLAVGVLQIVFYLD